MCGGHRHSGGILRDEHRAAGGRWIGGELVARVRMLMMTMMTLEEEIGRRNVRATHFPLNIFANFPLLKTNPDRSQSSLYPNDRCSSLMQVLHNPKNGLPRIHEFIVSGFLSSPLDYRVGRLTALSGLSSLRVWYFDVYWPV